MSQQKREAPGDTPGKAVEASETTSDSAINRKVRLALLGAQSCAPSVFTNVFVLAFFKMCKEAVELYLDAQQPQKEPNEEEECKKIVTRHPQVGEMYQYASIYTMQQTLREKDRDTKLHVGGLSHFLRRFYSAVLTSSPVRGGTFVRLTYFARVVRFCPGFFCVLRAA